ncbi:MAG: response regulator [Gemmatimonadaceae bacterium]
MTPAYGSPPIQGRPSALLVDDEGAIRSVLKRWLLRRGWHVEEAADGDVALAMIAARTGRAYDLIIADLRMERVGGADVFHWIVANRPDAVGGFVISTGDATEDGIAEFLREAACPVLRKPFELAELAKLVTGVQLVRGRAKSA